MREECQKRDVLMDQEILIERVLDTRRNVLEEEGNRFIIIH